MAADETMIEARELTKVFGSFVAVRDVSFQVGRGELVAFLGPNGAGKSTTMKMLTGFLSPTAGRAFVGGIDVAQDRIAAAEKFGYLPENGPVYDDMTPEAFLQFFGRARGMDANQRQRAIADVIDVCGLDSVVGKRIGKLSKGYRQRVGLAQSLLHQPDVLIMDEPTSGLDPNQIQDVRQALRQIAEKRTILLSTHLLQEVEALATRVLVISEGQLVFDDTPDALRRRGGDAGMEGAFHELTRSRAAAETPQAVEAEA
jgi:ABC-2 type transport system ATP-binding protein